MGHPVCIYVNLKFSIQMGKVRKFKINIDADVDLGDTEMEQLNT